MTTEYAFLIERIDTSTPLYWGLRDNDASPWWVEDAYKAIRFCRKQDAEAIMWTLGSPETRAVEHGFCIASVAMFPNDPVAQSVEQGSDKAVVAGSSPAGVATAKPGCFDCDYGNQPCHMNCGPARTRATAEALLETIYKDRVAVCCGPEAIWDSESDMLSAPENAIWKNIADFISRNEP